MIFTMVRMLFLTIDGRRQSLLGNVFHLHTFSAASLAKPCFVARLAIGDFSNV